MVRVNQPLVPLSFGVRPLSDHIKPKNVRFELSDHIKPKNVRFELSDHIKPKNVRFELRDPDLV
jgi:hypothetical protein